MQERREIGLKSEREEGEGDLGMMTVSTEAGRKSIGGLELWRIMWTRRTSELFCR